PEAIVADAAKARVFHFPNLGNSGGGAHNGAGQDEWNGFGDPSELPIDGQPGKVSTADVNKDGAVDLIVAIPGGGGGQPGSQLFLGDGNGAFTEATNLTTDFGQDDVQPGDLDNVKDLGVPTFADLAYVSLSSGLVG